MAAKDFIHDAVKNALVKDGWVSTDDPFTIRYRKLVLSADLGAERPIAAQRGMQRIVVEVKSFVSRSLIQDLEEALGQYNLYQTLLEVTEPERKLFLGVSEKTYEKFFAREEIKFVMQRLNVKMLVVNVDSEEVVQWIN